MIRDLQSLADLSPDALANWLRCALKYADTSKYGYLIDPNSPERGVLRIDREIERSIGSISAENRIRFHSSVRQSVCKLLSDFNPASDPFDNATYLNRLLTLIHRWNIKEVFPVLVQGIDQQRYAGLSLRWEDQQEVAIRTLRQLLHLYLFGFEGEQRAQISVLARLFQSQVDTSNYYIEGLAGLLDMGAEHTEDLLVSTMLKACAQNRAEELLELLAEPDYRIDILWYQHALSLQLAHTHASRTLNETKLRAYVSFADFAKTQASTSFEVCGIRDPGPSYLKHERVDIPTSVHVLSQDPGDPLWLVHTYDIRRQADRRDYYSCIRPYSDTSLLIRHFSTRHDLLLNDTTGEEFVLNGDMRRRSFRIPGRSLLEPVSALRELLDWSK